MYTALTIAGSDPSGGAGIQADIKTMTVHGVYAMSAVTALTVQNTMGVSGFWETEPECLASQLDCIFTDIFPDAVKIGMIFSEKLIEITARKLRQYRAQNIVVDPVMAATSGSKLMKDKAVSALKEEILPLASVLTPNIPEAAVLSGMNIQSPRDMEEAAKRIEEQYHCPVLCKGGHQTDDASDLLCCNGYFQWFYGRRIDNPNTHGTGCTLSSAIACNLAKGFSLPEAVKQAKDYLTQALKTELNLGRGNGPINHLFAISKQ